MKISVLIVTPVMEGACADWRIDRKRRDAEAKNAIAGESEESPKENLRRAQNEVDWPASTEQRDRANPHQTGPLEVGGRETDSNDTYTVVFIRYI